MNDLEATATTPATTKRPKRKLALSRHPLAVAARRAKGGGGGRLDAGVAPTIDKLPSKNLPQKDLTPAVAARIDALGAPVALAGPQTPAPTPDTPCDPLPVESTIPHLWGDGSFRAAVYMRPYNPRMLLLQFANGDHGRLVVSPRERGMFNIGAEVWVKPAGGKDFYILCGVYNRYGQRRE